MNIINGIADVVSQSGVENHYQRRQNKTDDVGLSLIESVSFSAGNSLTEPGEQHT
jgi:hypothetical protein